MTDFVLDASVAAKWVLPAAREPLAGEANELLRRFVDGETGFLVPDLFWAECANILWKNVYLGRITRDKADLGAATLQGYNFPAIPSRLLLNDAIRLAHGFSLPAYDFFYVALALRENIQMITADEKLADALAARLPIKWLGSI